MVIVGWATNHIHERINDSLSYIDIDCTGFGLA